jgi:hypothetical protein
MSDKSSPVLGPSETCTKSVPGLGAKLWWAFNDEEGMILRFHDGADVVGERRFADLIEAETFFEKLLTLPVRHGRPGARSAAGLAYYWLDGARWLVQVGDSAVDELGTAAFDRVCAAECAAYIAQVACSRRQ